MSKNINDFELDKSVADNNLYCELCLQFIPNEDTNTMRLFSANFSRYGRAGLDLSQCLDITLKEVINELLDN